jgi:ATP-dependent Clp protease ATP-binding subunit ClpA
MTPRMQHIMQRAEELAQQRGLASIGTEHVMLALLDDRRAIATMALAVVTTLPVCRKRSERSPTRKPTTGRHPIRSRAEIG